MYNGKYLSWSGNRSADAKLTNTETILTLTDGTYNNEEIVTIGLYNSTATNKYLNYYDANGLGGWTQDGTGDDGSAFKLAQADEGGELSDVTVDDLVSGNQYYIVSLRGDNTKYSNKKYLSLSNTTSYEGKGFYFTDTADGKPDRTYVPSFSKWDSKRDNNIHTQNYYIYSGLAASKLSESSNVPFSDEVNAANLFATDGSNTDYTSVYTNVQVPFVYDPETGYYTLSSDDNAVYFANGTGASDSTMLIADKPAAYRNSTIGSYDVTGFQPFSSLSSNTKTERAVKSARKVNADNANTSAYTCDPTYGFGLVTDVTFQMTDTGKDAKGNDIVFEFSGDDDVWVYIDGVLALDIGGTHDAINGKINFATGDVTLSSSYGKVGDKAADKDMSEYANLNETLSQTNLYEALGTTLTGFAAQGNHNLTIYYMDRGQGRTNCLIKFNLPQRDSLSVTKNITQSKTPSGATSPLTEAEQANINGVDFGFTLYRDDNPVPNKTYYLTYTEDGVEKQTTASTDANGHFTLKNGQTAKFLGEISSETKGTQLYVVEDTLDTNAYTTPEYSYTTNISGGVTAEDASEFTSMKLTAVGSDTAADTIAITCTNYLNATLPNPSIQPADDMIVVDYGLPISISTEKLLSNDTRRGDSFEITKVEGGSYGTAVLNKDGTITYTLEKRLDGIEELIYTAVAHSTNEEVEDSEPATGKIKIIPATSVYYEEHFGSEGNELVTTKTKNATFTTEGISLTGYQETGYVGDPNDSTYGADAVYMDNLGDSYGTSLKADTTNGAAQYSYTFTGTGTTIYGRVSNVTGYIRVTVTNSAGEEVDKQYIDTINYVTVPDGGTEQILDTTLYNIPIYQNTGLESGYDTYKVTIYVYKSGTLHDVNNEFYLDGIRVFQPMGDDPADGYGYETANSAYAADGEQNVAVVNIRDKIAADTEGEYANDIFTLTDVNGVIVDVADYTDIGPNQELYLKESYSGSFALVNWDSKNYKLYLGMKAPNGKSAQVTIGGKDFEINNSADCYYDISDCVESETLDDGTVVGYVKIEGVSGLTALTNIKVTGMDEFNLAYSENLNKENEDIETGNEEEAQTLYLVSRTYAESMTAEEETPIFTPASITVSCSYASKSKRATVNVVTSKDVNYVTIDGVKVTGKNVSGKLRFTLSYKKVEAGTTWDIVAYNADGVASEHYTATAQ
ncbi:Ig-like domain-containing protein [Butyricicoccus porcorum]|uniref:Ig-like domain-containing protein n=1 Tax=Butyricicoccus porcorum TaxID=1945634 RepID=UPI003F4AD24F